MLLHTAFFPLPLAESRGACSGSRAGDGVCWRREKGKEMKPGSTFLLQASPLLLSPEVKETLCPQAQDCPLQNRVCG